MTAGTTATTATPAPGGPGRIAVSRTGSVATITLGDGRRRNALGEADWVRLDIEIARLANDRWVRAIVLVGRGATFSAGSDLTEWEAASAADVERTLGAIEQCLRRIELAPVPVIAAVGGVAAGAGCQLALACDLAVLERSARIGMPIARLGILASPAFVARVSSRVGATLAADLYLTGRLLRADEADNAGLVSRVVPAGESLPAAYELATAIAAQPSAAIASAKHALRLVTRTDPTAAGSEEVPTVAFDEFHTAVGAFVAHRTSA
ncbi:MAG TPA: enoyl-CoA hydratase/isomerase family protein [Flexivirga sp.]|uniref:enoyl-CoA hydratase/isomerase family protein n=1 Tax=Flexivirga sp. TaxID=1962927 RepID=UPI002B8676D8|nr:enoyl-CoA hydratase/isomerase family protein [Flexivirga sp.]HWC24041.1 enoyl-CoA hydratase/isomerase family protein [Flexivirga sp.]